MLVARPDPAGHHLVTAGWRGAGPRPGHPRRPSVDRAVVAVTGGTTSGKRATASGAVAGAGELTYRHGGRVSARPVAPPVHRRQPPPGPWRQHAHVLP